VEAQAAEPLAEVEAEVAPAVERLAAVVASAGERPVAEVEAAVAVSAPVVAVARSDAPALPAAAVRPGVAAVRRRLADAGLDVLRVAVPAVTAQQPAGAAVAPLTAKWPAVVAVANLGALPRVPSQDVVQRLVVAVRLPVAAMAASAVVVAAAGHHPVRLLALRAAGACRDGRVRLCRAPGALAPRLPAGSGSSFSAP